MPAFSDAHFLRAASQPADFPPPDRPELAFAGRSNVGKSSAINAILRRRSLARTSKTPGRTQTLNFYGLGEEARLVDLPGYGYAKVPKPLRAQWGEVVGAYLEKRTCLRGIVVVMDARRPATPSDLQLLGWMSGRRLLVLLSKADKLTKAEQAATLRDATQLIPRADTTEVRLFSSVTRQGVDECRDLLEGWISSRPPK